MLKIPFSHHLFRRRQMVWYSSLQLVSSFVSQSSLQDRLLASSSLRSRYPILSNSNFYSSAPDGSNKKKDSRPKIKILRQVDQRQTKAQAHFQARVKAMKQVCGSLKLELAARIWLFKIKYPKILLFLKFLFWGLIMVRAGLIIYDNISALFASLPTCHMMAGAGSSVGSGDSGINSGWTSLLGSGNGNSSSGSSEDILDQPPHANAESRSAPPQHQTGEPSHRCPYQPDEVIGGDSIDSIQQRLLSRYRSPSADVIERARIDAEDLFEVKAEIIQTMTPLHPEGDWLRRGARALDNNRTTTGEESLAKLYAMLEDLKANGIKSISFHNLKSKVFLRIDDIDSNSEIH